MEMKEVKISVIIPTYKPEDYFRECLQCLNNQTLEKDTFETIIILNGCKEPWLSYINRLIENTPNLNINLIQTDVPGVSNARNIGLDVAKGEFITFIDDDDFISPHYLEELLKVSSATCVGLSDSIYFYDKSGKFDERNIHHKEFIKLRDIRSPSLYSARRFFNGPVMKLIHRSIIGDRRFDVRFKNGEDSLFMTLISDRIKKIKFTSKEAVYYRRIRNNSATTSKRSIYLKIRNGYNLIIQYTKYWLKEPAEYNSKFIISRIIGTLKI